MRPALPADRYELEFWFVLSQLPPTRKKVGKVGLIFSAVANGWLLALDRRLLHEPGVTSLK